MKVLQPGILHTHFGV